MRRIAITTAFLALACATAAMADDAPGRVRTWAFGWEDGLTLRKAFGLWDVSLSAGPSDWLQRTDTYSWDTDLPDSTQGGLSHEYDDSRESGFVRVSAARELTRWRTLSLHGGCGVRYLWGNEWDTSVNYDSGGAVSYRRRTEYHEDRFSVDLGVRMAWRPVPIVSVQLRAGLVLTSIHG
ncbi:MAG TPA: hypothetical protein PLQ13_13560, partial [Candidatus Krumholzibacteria bacterium]|nr:hypothetical protein [Candidatus Krumholzibacteria bacterium]